MHQQKGFRLPFDSIGEKDPFADSNVKALNILNHC
jgi:hypothetical protein